MPVSPLEALACDLADAGKRQETARKLAAQLGAKFLIAFVRDPEITTLVPAPGYVQTIAGGARWTEFLAGCREPGVHHGEVSYPDPSQIQRAAARTMQDGTVFVLIGSDPRIEVLPMQQLHLLAALYVAESRVTAANGRASVAQETARHAKALMAAVDAARSEAVAARSAAEVAARAKDEFLAVLGHEMRNPLAPIVTALHLMRLKDDEAFKTERDVIERQVTHMSRLVDDLLDVSRIASGRIDLKHEYVDLQTVATNAAEMVAPLMEQRRHQLRLELGEAAVMGDAVRLQQILANLLTNAARYTHEGGVIDLKLECRDGRATVRVRDNGMGINRQMLPLVFDLFVQADQTLERSRGGLGLGLAIVKNLARLHGGDVEALSEGPGRGSEFIVRLPAVPRRAPARSMGWDRLPVPRACGEHILVVDDNRDSADMLAEGLRHIGYVAQVAYDGPSALLMAADRPPAAAILDIGLPNMNGYELARALRAADGLGELPLIALTGYGRDRDRQASREAGINLHLSKPVEPELLASVLEKYVRRAAK